MRIVVLILTCLASEIHGRRVRTLAEHAEPTSTSRERRLLISSSSNNSMRIIRMKHCEGKLNPFKVIARLLCNSHHLAAFKPPIRGTRFSVGNPILTVACAKHGLEPKLESLAKAFGVEFSEAVSIFGTVSGERGVVASADIDRGSLLVSMPSSNCLVVPAGTGNDDAELVSEFIAALQRPDWSSYAENILPVSTDATFLWSDDELRELQFSQAVEYAEEVRVRCNSMLVDDNDDIEDNEDNEGDEDFDDDDDNDGVDEDVTPLDQLKWAQGVIYSRSFLLEGDADKKNINGSKPVRVLAPFLDLFNHVPESPLEYAQRLPAWEADGYEEPPTPWQMIMGTGGEARVAIFADQDVKSGEEVLIPYGPETSAEHLSLAGFVPTPNSADYIPLFVDNVELVSLASEALGLDEEQARKRLQIIEKLDAVDAPLAVRPGELDASGHLLGVIHLVASSDDELDGFKDSYNDAIGHYTLIPPPTLSYSSESAAMSFLENTTEAALDECPTTLEEDEQQLSDIMKEDGTREQNRRLILALEYRIAVKRMLHHFLKSCKAAKQAATAAATGAASPT